MLAHRNIETVYDRSRVFNVPNYAHNFSYWVAKKDIHGRLWFWCARREYLEALEEAQIVKGFVVCNN